MWGPADEGFSDPEMWMNTEVAVASRLYKVLLFRDFPNGLQIDRDGNVTGPPEARGPGA
jgi:hypothetical protein